MDSTRIEELVPHPRSTFCSHVQACRPRDQGKMSRSVPTNQDALRRRLRLRDGGFDPAPSGRSRMMSARSRSRTLMVAQHEWDGRGPSRDLGDHAALAKAGSALAIRSNRCPNPAPSVPL